MFFEKYLNPIYLDLLYDNYEQDYLNLFDENNFKEVYQLLKENNFYFIEDIIINYLDLFEIEAKYVQLALIDVKALLGNDYVKQIGKNMMLVDKIIELAINYQDI